MVRVVIGLNSLRVHRHETRLNIGLKKKRREENIEKGKEMLERELKRNHFNPSNVLKADWMSEIIKRISVKDLDELYAAIGYGGIMINQVLPKVREKHKELQRQLQAEQKQQQSIEEQTVHVDKKKPRHNKGNQGVIVKGMDGILVRFANVVVLYPATK